MLVCQVYQFVTENTVDNKFLFTSEGITGFASVKRGGAKSKVSYRTPNKPLDKLQSGGGSSHRILNLSTTLELLDIDSQKLLDEGNNDALGDEGENDCIMLNVKISSKSSVLLFNAMAFLSMEKFRSKPETRHQLTLNMYKQPLISAYYSAEAMRQDANLLASDGKLYMTVIYTNDYEHPSVWNQLLCGMSLVPQVVKPIERGETPLSDIGAATALALCGSDHSSEPSATTYLGTMKEESPNGGKSRSLTAADKQSGAGVAGAEVFDFAAFMESIVSWPNSITTTTISSTASDPDTNKVRDRERPSSPSHDRPYPFLTQQRTS